MNRIALILALALLAPAVAALEDPKQMGGLDATVEMSWSIAMPADMPPTLNVEATVYGFNTNDKQQVLYENTQPEAVITPSLRGDRYWEFDLGRPGPSTTVRFGTLTQLRTSYSGVQVDSPTLPLTDPDQTALNGTEFTRPNAEIAAKAAELAGNSSDELEVIAALTEWVHNSITYDKNYWPNTKTVSAAEVWRDRRGVCGHYAHLLIAMLLSRGIPARTVGGFVYSGEEWAPHAWVEAQTNDGWIEVDPTYNEVGILDASHLRFATGADYSQILEEITVRGPQYDPSGLVLQPHFSINVTDSRPFPALVDLRIDAPREVSAGERALVNATLTNLAGRDLVMPLDLNPSHELSTQDFANRLVRLRPGENRTVEWQLLIPADLASGYTYSFPVEVRTLGRGLEITLEAHSGRVIASPQARIAEVFGGPGAVSVKVTNTGNVPVTAIAQVTINGQSRGIPVALAPGDSRTLQVPVTGATRAIGAVSLELDGTFVDQKSFDVDVSALASPATSTPTEAAIVPPGVFNTDVLYLAAAVAVFVLGLGLLGILALSRRRAG